MSTEREGGWPFNLSRGKVIARRWRIEKLIREGIFNSYYFEVTDLKRPIRTYMMKVTQLKFQHSKLSLIMKNETFAL